MPQNENKLNSYKDVRKKSYITASELSTRVVISIHLEPKILRRSSVKRFFVLFLPFNRIEVVRKVDFPSISQTVFREALSFYY